MQIPSLSDKTLTSNRERFSRLYNRHYHLPYTIPQTPRTTPKPPTITTDNKTNNHHQSDTRTQTLLKAPPLNLTQPIVETANTKTQPNQNKISAHSEQTIPNLTHLGTTYSALRHQRAIYTIALIAQTQRTHIIQIAEDGHQNYQCCHERIQKWIPKLILCTTPNRTTPNKPSKIHKQLLILIKSLASVPNTNPLLHQNSAIISDIHDRETHSLNLTQHTMATQIIKILLDQFYFATWNFAAKLQKNNSIMTTFILKTTNPSYTQYTKIRTQYPQFLTH